MKIRVSRRAAAITALGGAAGLASAQTTPTMGPVAFPIDLASIITEVGTAGGAMLVLVFGLSVGFYLARKLFKRALKAV